MKINDSLALTFYLIEEKVRPPPCGPINSNRHLITNERSTAACQVLDLMFLPQKTTSDLRRDAKADWLPIN